MELSKPHVERCFHSHAFESPLPAMELRWSSVAEQDWHMPAGVVLQGAPPQRFGITIHRQAKNSYRVRILWNRLCLSWDELTRVQIMSSSLDVILSALGTDLWRLVNQAVEEAKRDRAA